MRKTLNNLLLSSAILLSSLGAGCIKAVVIDNYKNPELFYAIPEGERSSFFDLMATAGVVMGVKADNENQAAVGAALGTFGALKSNKEAAREGKAEVNVSQNVQTAVADATSTLVPEYNLQALGIFYRDGHLLSAKVIDNDPMQKLLFGESNVLRHDILEVDGLQYLFTHNRKLDLNGDGFSFEEYMGVKRNFRKGEPLEVCLGLRGSAMKIEDKQTRETLATINLRLLNEKGDLINDVRYEEIFQTFGQEKFLYWNLNDLNLEKGFYILEADYSDTYDIDKDKRKRKVSPNSKLTTLRQFFQIHE